MSQSVRLTRDAAKLLVLIYRHYLAALDNGCDDFHARYIGDSFEVISLFSLPYSPSLTTLLLLELDRHGFVSAINCDDIAADCELSREGIAYMEGIWVDVAHALGKGITAAVDVVLKFL